MPSSFRILFFMVCFDASGRNNDDSFAAGLWEIVRWLVPFRVPQDPDSSVHKMTFDVGSK